MARSLFILPSTIALAAGNMARDWLLLEDFPHPYSPRFRHYGWTQPTATFGYAQSWSSALTSTPAHTTLIRRPTGGGLVQHANDWTYALVLPADHPVARARATESYCAIHKALQHALAINGVPAKLAPSQNGTRRTSGNLFQICFNHPVTSDVMRANDGRKIAGAAQRRNRNGLLIQGTLDLAAAPEVRDWKVFLADFTASLAEILNAAPELYDGNSLSTSTFARETTRFASAEWNQRR